VVDDAYVAETRDPGADGCAVAATEIPVFSAVVTPTRSNSVKPRMQDLFLRRHFSGQGFGRGGGLRQHAAQPSTVLRGPGRVPESSEAPSSTRCPATDAAAVRETFCLVPV